MAAGRRAQFAVREQCLYMCVALASMRRRATAPGDAALPYKSAVDFDSPTDCPRAGSPAVADVDRCGITEVRRVMEGACGGRRRPYLAATVALGKRLRSFDDQVHARTLRDAVSTYGGNGRAGTVVRVAGQGVIMAGAQG